MQEDGTSEMRWVQATAETINSAVIAYVELRAAAGAGLRTGRIPSDGRPELIASLEDLWEGVSPVPLTNELLRRAGDLAEEMRLRASDAVHLAALLASGAAGDVSFACWDIDLRRAASSLGYTLFPD